MNNSQVFLALLGACIGTIIFLCALWYLAPFIMVIMGLIGFFMLLGYLKEKFKSGE